jgi:hypothetical protein
MCEYGGFKVSNLAMEDKFAYLKALKEVHQGVQ